VCVLAIKSRKQKGLCCGGKGKKESLAGSIPPLKTVAIFLLGLRPGAESAHTHKKKMIFLLPVSFVVGKVRFCSVGSNPAQRYWSLDVFSLCLGWECSQPCEREREREKSLVCPVDIVDCGDGQK
jgi:hypothetical protein